MKVLVVLSFLLKAGVVLAVLYVLLQGEPSLLDALINRINCIG